MTDNLEAFLTEKNARAYAAAQDKLVYLADLSGMRIDNPKLEEFETRIEKLSAKLLLADSSAEILELLKRSTFVVESVAHLKGLESELLPLADASRRAIRRIEGNKPWEQANT